MQSPRAFGRKASPQRAVSTPPPPRAIAAPVPLFAPQQALAPPIAIKPSDDVEAELEQWKAARKIHKRSFREPWRSVSIAASIGFGLSSWLLPDSVANVAEVVTTALGLASLIAGFRKPRATPPVPAEAASRS